MKLSALIPFYNKNGGINPSSQNAPPDFQGGPPPVLERDRSFFLFSVAFLLRFTVFLFIFFRYGDAGFILPPYSDAVGYVTIAQNVLEGRGFSLEESPPYLPDAKRVPIYPLFLALTFLFTSGKFWLASLIQIILSALIVLLVYRLGKMLFTERAAFIAGVFAAMQPYNLLLSTQLYAEILFTLVFLCAFIFFVRIFDADVKIRFLGAGILIGIATLIKPVAQYVPILVLPFLALRGGWDIRLKRVILYLAGLLIIITPWVARNYYTFGVPTISYEANILFSMHIAGYKSYKETGAASGSGNYRKEDTRESILETPRAELVLKTLRVIWSDPVGFSKYLAISVVPFIFGDGFVTITHALSDTSSVPAWDFSTSASALARTIGFGVLPPWLLILSILSKALWGVVLLGSVAGFVVLLRGGANKRLISVTVALILLYFMLPGGPVNSARYRVPVEPIIFVLAGAGICVVWAKFKMKVDSLNHE